MKKLIFILLALISLKANAQTYWTTSPAGFSALTPAFRFKPVTPDSLNQLLIFNPLTARYNRVYTATEANALFTQASNNKNTQIDFYGKSVYFMGDSYWAGSGASVTGKRATTLIAGGLGAVEQNFGVAGSTMEKRAPIDYQGATNMVDRVSQIPTKTNTMALLVFEFGLNDMGQNGANYTPANYITDYSTVLNNALSKGWLPSQILLISPAYIGSAGYAAYATITGNAAPTRAHHLQFVTATQTISNTFKTLYLDLFHDQMANDTTLIGADHIHPTDAGHAYIANDVIKFLHGGLSYGTKVPSGSSKPLNLNLGASYSTNLLDPSGMKLPLYDDGVPANRFGLSVSLYSVDGVPRLEYFVPKIGGHIFGVRNTGDTQTDTEIEIFHDTTRIRNVLELKSVPVIATTATTYLTALPNGTIGSRTPAQVRSDIGIANLTAGNGLSGGPYNGSSAITLTTNEAYTHSWSTNQSFANGLVVTATSNPNMVQITGVGSGVASWGFEQFNNSAHTEIGAIGDLSTVNDNLGILGVNGLDISAPVTTFSGDVSMAIGTKLTATTGVNGRAGSITLVAGTKSLTITGLTTSSLPFVQLDNPSGSVSQYVARCTANTLTVTALTVPGGALNVTDVSTLHYFIIN